MCQWKYGLVALAFTVVALAACQRQGHFDPELAARFLPLQVGSSWVYEVVYPNGARETITDRVLKDPRGTSLGGGLVVSAYSGLDGSRSVRAELARLYPAERTEFETRYIVKNGYITRIEDLGGASGIRFEERAFLPQYLWPGRKWSTSLVPFEPSPGPILTLTQNHRSFLERHRVAVPAGHFSGCIRIETEVSYHRPDEAVHKRLFTDWYAADVGLIKTVVQADGPNGREMARIQLVRFAKSETVTPLQSANRPLISPPSNGGLSATRESTSVPFPVLE
jgi:hypothetical protein